jgi:ribonuclease H / adenosylcobalamin/alpha-ribazole phosphatase
MPRAVRAKGKTMKDSERRRLSKASRAAAAGGAEAVPPHARPGFAVLWCDGGSRGNPGPAAVGYLIHDTDGVELARSAESIGVTTAGTAEHRALSAGLAAALGLGLSKLEVRSDSRLLVERMRGNAPVRNPALAAHQHTAAELATRIGSVVYRWVPREHNRAADELVASRLGSAEGRSPQGTA